MRDWVLLCTTAQEMVGPPGPLRKGDEVELLIPPRPPSMLLQTSQEGSGAGAPRRAVGAIRVQVRLGVNGTWGDSVIFGLEFVHNT